MKHAYFKSNIVFKTTIFMVVLIVGYTLATILFTLPEIDRNVMALEEKNGKAVLDKVVTLSKNVANSLDNFKQESLRRHKEELKNIIDIAASSIRFELDRIKDDNIDKMMEEKGELFKNNFITFYRSNISHLDMQSIKKISLNYLKEINDLRKKEYFYIIDRNGTTILDGSLKMLKGKSFNRPAGLTCLCSSMPTKVYSYETVDKKSGKKDTIHGYIFLFEPFGWYIGMEKSYSDIKREHLDRVCSMLSSLRYGKNFNYLFAIDYKGFILAHPYLKRGVDLKKYRGAKGAQIAQPMIKIALGKGDGYTSYWWKKNNGDPKPFEKLSYVRNIPKWKMIIGTGVYIDDIEKEVERRKKQLIDQLEYIMIHTKIGKTGYLYIFDKNGNIVIHPNAYMKGKDIRKMKNPGTDEFIFDSLIKAYNTTGTLRYKWDRPDDKNNYIYDKISWIDYVPELGWYIVSSAYIDEFEDTSILLREKIIKVGIIVLIFSIMIGIFFLRRFLQPIVDLSGLTSKVANGDYSIRSDFKSNDEIGELAKNFNTMVETIRDNIENLDKKVKEKTMELEQQKNVFEKLFYKASDPIALIHNYKFVKFNRSFKDILGYEKDDDIYNIHPSEISPEYQPDGELSETKADRMMNDCLKEGHVKFEWVHKKADGELFWVYVSFTSITIEGEDYIHVLWRDITEIKKLEDKLKDAKKKAEESAKLKSEFLANMSHEIRTPMNAITGMTHLALQTDLDEKQKNYLNKIDRSAKALLGIINDILDFSKIEAGKLDIEKVEFDLFETVDSVVEIIGEKSSAKGLEMIVKYDRDICSKYYGDPLRISQILINLMGNAVKFTQKGHIGIDIVKIGKNRVKFEVFDTGIGLTPEQKSRLFKAFSQADSSTTRKYGGTGLGLAISKKLVELMNGRIWVESEYGKGSRFIFEIDLEERSSAGEEFRRFDGKRVLIVDDSKSWHTILGETLAMFGVESDSAYSGMEALEKLDECKNLYDLILMDWSMPGMDGIEAGSRIHEMCMEHLDMPEPVNVIMISAYRQESIVKKAKEKGMDIFLQKPVNPKLLNDVLANIFYGDVRPEKVDESADTEKRLHRRLSTLRGGRILLVEDNDMNREIISGLLEGSGIVIEEAFNGAEAVEKYEKGKYDLILMDIQMPVMDGFEATKRIREMDGDIPIIALTANAMKEDVEKTAEVGMNRHLNKPIDVISLYRVLLEYIPVREDISDMDEEVRRPDKERKDGEEIPEMKHIDIKEGLSHVGGMKKLYIKILRDFMESYRDFSIDDLEGDEFKRAIHTLKGLSANIGAGRVHEVAVEVDSTLDRSLLPSLYSELSIVIEELEGLTILREESGKEEKREEKRALDESTRVELIEKLWKALKSRQPKKCKPVIEEIEGYELDGRDAEIFSRIEKLVSKYRFKEAISLMEELKNGEKNR